MSAPARRKGWNARPLADLIQRQLDPLVAKQGFSEASLLMQWREIVGARFAALCEPIKLQWPPRPRGRTPEKSPEKRERPQEPATLLLRVEPGFGLDIQHMAPAIMDRVNAHLGWRCVAQVRLRQEPLAGGKPARPPRPVLPSDPKARARAAAAAADLHDEGLREALTRLGESALAEKSRRA